MHIKCKLVYMSQDEITEAVELTKAVRSSSTGLDKEAAAQTC